jgi:uncharacterized protein YjcR
MMARPSVLWESPELLEKIIEYMALGLPQREIALMLGVHESTVSKWKTRKDISNILATKTLEILAEPAKTLARVNPGLFLQTHPATRESHAPPTNKTDISGKTTSEVLVKVEFVAPDAND